MTVQSAALVADLKALVLRLEDDLRERVQSQSEVLAAWQDEHRRAAAAERTASTWQAWRDDRVTQAAVAWVLTTVFVRFCEDNALLRPVWISGPPARRQEALDAEAAYFRAHPEDTHREWLLQAIEHLRRTPATAALVDERSALWTVSPSGRSSTALLTFWRERAEGGELVRDFADPALDTRFLGDLYQDLSEHAKKTYALLQTPDFVEEFILDRTLEPALAERPLEGFKLIDPACGSGHFVLGAFTRLLDRWHRHAPGLEPRVRVQKALDSVWGVDINPFAIAIARFRLLLAALDAVGARSFEGAPDFEIHLLAGDSLYFANDPHQQSLVPHASFAFSAEDASALEAALALGTYDAVVANPPYITVKDAKLNAAYRERYNHLKGKYQLTAPFMELLFKLSKPQSGDQPAGWVGQITSNAFMKREFGVPMVENLLAHLDLRLVVDTSGAYIPGHGTPTIILVGRNRSPESATLRAVLGVRGEPGRPEDPVLGQVWTAIMQGVDAPGTANAWINVADLDRASLAHHPWSLSGGGAVEALATVEANRTATLAPQTHRIGVFGIMGNDDAMMVYPGVPHRMGLEPSATAELVVGDIVRDFRISDTWPTWFPYTGRHKLRRLAEFPRWAAHLWRTRTDLGNRATFTKGTYFSDGRPFYEWHQLPQDLGAHPWVITFAFVATHNHFVLDRGGKVFNRSAPVIKLPAGASEDDHLRLLGVLNSSTACSGLSRTAISRALGASIRSLAPRCGRASTSSPVPRCRSSRFRRTCRWSGHASSMGWPRTCQAGRCRL